MLESFRSKLVKEGFDVTIYEPENFETAKFDVGTFKKSYDLVIYIGNVENASNKVTNRLSWYTFWGNGNNVLVVCCGTSGDVHQPRKSVSSDRCADDQNLYQRIF